MKKGYFFLVLIAVLIGAGCSENRIDVSSIRIGGLPKLEVVSPPNAFQTSSTNVIIEGRTSAEQIFINDVAYLVEGKPFQIPIDIHLGSNVITIYAGTGYTTSTVTRIIERL